MTQIPERSAPAEATHLTRTVRILIIPLMLVLGIFAAVRVSLPETIRNGTWSSEFSTERALRDVDMIARQPHPMGTEANHAVRDYLVAELTTLGLTVDVQRAEVVSRFAERTVAGTVENIVAVRKGAAPMGKALALMSHYDSVPHAPGAADDASSIAAILEMLRTTARGAPTANDVVVVFTDGEERGMLGAQAFIDRHPLGRQIGLILNFEARGTEGPVLLFQTSRKSAALVRQFAAGAPAPIADSVFDAIYQIMPNDTDLSVTLASGVPGMNFAFIEGAQNYHNGGDSRAHLSADSVRHAGSLAVSLVQRFGNTPLPMRAVGDEGYFNVTAGRLVEYPLWLGDVLLGVALVLFLDLVRREGGPALSVARQVWTGAMFSLLVTFTVFVAITLTNGLVRVFAGESGVRGVETELLIAYACLTIFIYLALVAWVERGVGWIGIILATTVAAVAVAAARVPVPVIVITAALVGALLACVRGRRDVRSFTPGVLAVWLLSSAATVFLLPGAMHLLIVPCLILLLSEWAGRACGWAEERRAAIVALVSTVLCVWWLGYYVRALHLGLGATVPGLGLALVALMLVAMTRLMRARWAIAPWLEQSVYVAAGLAVLAAVTFVDALDPARMRSTEVIYARDSDADQSYWVSTDRQPDAWVRQFVGATPREMSSASFFPGSAGVYRVGQAPGGAMAAPSLAIASETATADGRRVQLHIVPGRIGTELNLFLQNPATIRAADLNGTPVDVKNGSRGWWRVTYYAMPLEGVRLNLTLAPGAPVHARITEVVYEWSDAIKTATPSRPASTMPRPGGYSDMMLITRAFAPDGPSARATVTARPSVPSSSPRSGTP